MTTKTLNNQSLVAGSTTFARKQYFSPDR